MSGYQILKNALATDSVCDDALQAKAVLAERLNNLKAVSDLFAGVSFSADIECLSKNTSMAVA